MKQPKPFPRMPYCREMASAKAPAIEFTALLPAKTAKAPALKVRILINLLPHPVRMLCTAPPQLESDRLLIRLVEERDLPALLDMHSVDEVNRFLPYTTWKTIDDARAWYEHAMSLHTKGNALQFVAVEKQSGLVLGSCLLFHYEETNGRAEIGYALDRRYWGAGYMRETLELLITFAFNGLSLRRLEAEVDPHNTSSNGLLLRLGFTREGLLRQRWVMKGEIRDSHIYGLLRHEWPAALKMGALPATSPSPG